MVPSAPPSHTRGPSAFALLLRTPGGAAFSATGLLARLPISMIGLTIVLLVTGRESSYALAGALAASYALAAALIAPYGARLIDRLGQGRVIVPLALLQSGFLLAMVAGFQRGVPLPALFAVAVAAGGVGPNIGSLVRARWIALLRGDPLLRTGLAWESILDEIVFIVGPPLATFVALQASPAVGMVGCAALITGGTLLLALQRSTEPPPAPKGHGAAGGHAARLPGMPWLIGVMVLLGSVFGAFEVTTVAYAAAEGVAGSTGWLLAAYAAGSLIGGVVIGSIRLGGTLTSQLRGAALVLAGVSLPLALVPGPAALALLAAAAGFAVAPVLILASSLLEVLVPAARITEALTVTTSGLAVGLAVAAPAAGLVIDTWAPVGGYALMAASALGSALVMLAASPRLGRLETARARIPP